ncbi:hypothetical protein K9L05_01880 [Candidatus Babeliales bacterium]|nr:hypothetical protein [Candidatus Babeliales bacterium]
MKNFNFGTDGIRGNAAKYPFTPKALFYLGNAIAEWSSQKYNKKPKILIGHDTRISCETIKKNLIKGLQNYKIDIIDCKILPTPAICLLTQKSELQFDFGIVISASHNPYYDNGIKLFDKINTKISRNDEECITNLFKQISKARPTSSLNPEFFYNIWEQADSEYKNNIFSFFEPNFLKNIKIVLDCANGANYKIAPEIFKDLGAQTISINTNPNGKNINKNCGSVHPENLQKAVIDKKADIGFAFDGDGDRLIAVNKNGKILDGDNILSILIDHPKFKNLNQVIGTVMSNYGFENYLEKLNKKLHRTSVGDKHIAAQLIKENLLLGGENSGHIIMRDYMNSGDGIFCALRLLQTILLTNNNWDLEKFIKTPQTTINLPIKKRDDLSKEPYNIIIENNKKLLSNGRILVRYSGTENLLRIMVEDIDAQLSQQVAQNLVQELKTCLT